MTQNISGPSMPTFISAKSGWAAEAIHALQLYPVAKPWKTVYDLGPNDDHLHAHVSFASQKIALASDYRAQPTGNRQHDTIGDDQPHRHGANDAAGRAAIVASRTR